MTFEQVGQDYNEAVRRRAEKEHELLLGAREQREHAAQPDTTPEAPSSLDELRSAFLAMKRKERKRDRTPLDEYTIRGYEGLIQDFIHITKCQYPGDITGDRVNDWMPSTEWRTCTSHPCSGRAPCRYLRVSDICTYKSTTYGGGRMRVTATIDIANLAPGEHKVSIVLVDATHNPFPGQEVTMRFTIPEGVPVSH